MKKSDIFEFVAPDTEGAIIDRYAVSDLTTAMNAFMSKHYHGSVSITSTMDSVSYINIQGYKTALLIHRALALNAKDVTLDISLKEIDDTFYIAISAEDGLKISEEEKVEIIELARAAGFYINVSREQGVIIAKCETQLSSVTFSAQDGEHPFYKELERAFMK